MSAKKQTTPKVAPVKEVPPTPTPTSVPVKEVKKVANKPVPKVEVKPAPVTVEQPKPKAQPKTKAPKVEVAPNPVAEPVPVPAKTKKVAKPKAEPVTVNPVPTPEPDTPKPKAKRVVKPKAPVSDATTEKEPVKAKEPKATEQPTTEQEALPGGKRYFKYIKGDEAPKGKYLAKKPKQAAVKAFSTISKNIRKSATDDSFIGVENKFYVAEYKGKGKIAKLIPYVGTIKLLDKPVSVPIRDKNKQPIMVTGADGQLVQKTITYKFDNHVVRDKTQSKIIVAPTETEQKEAVADTETKEAKQKAPTKPRTKKAKAPVTDANANTTVTESSAHTLTA